MALLIHRICHLKRFYPKRVVKMNNGLDCEMVYGLLDIYPNFFTLIEIINIYFQFCAASVRITRYRYSPSIGTHQLSVII